MKKIFFTFLVFLLSSPIIYADNLIKDALLGDTIGNGDIIQVTSTSDEGILGTIFIFIKDSIFGLLMLFGVGTFLFIGARLVYAKGNAEEFKKAMQSLIYAIVGLTVVSLAWATVRLVSQLNI